jgi:putative DNA primase/helicase
VIEHDDYEEAGGADPSEDELTLAFLPGTFPLTEFGNAERMVAQHRGNVRYCAERKLWLVWDGRQWQWDKQRLIVRKAKATVRALAKEAFMCSDPERRKELLAWALKSEKSSCVNAMLELAKSEMGIPVTVLECNSDPWLLNCLNGTVELRTGKLREHRREDLITKCTGVTYRPEATSVLWWKILERTCSGDLDLMGYLKRTAGYSLAGVATEKAFFFFHGPPDSGKSTLINAMHACLGDYAQSTDFETWLERPVTGGTRGDLVMLEGCRFVSSVEVNKKAKWDSAQLKRMTGGDMVTAAAKYEAEVSYIPQCTIMMAANDAPKFRADDTGLLRRLHTIHIKDPIPEGEQIKEMSAILRQPENSEAILAWAVEGCLEWQARGIGKPRVVLEATEKYRSDNDWLQGFLELFELDDASHVRAPTLRTMYVSYCKEEGQFADSTKELSSQIEARLPTVRYVKVMGERVWKGLRVREVSPYPSVEEASGPIPSPQWTEDPEQQEMY